MHRHNFRTSGMHKPNSRTPHVHKTLWETRRGQHVLGKRYSLPFGSKGRKQCKVATSLIPPTASPAIWRLSIVKPPKPFLKACTSTCISARALCSQIGALTSVHPPRPNLKVFRCSCIYRSASFGKTTSQTQIVFSKSPAWVKAQYKLRYTCVDYIIDWPAWAKTQPVQQT